MSYEIKVFQGIATLIFNAYLSVAKICCTFWYELLSIELSQTFFICKLVLNYNFDIRITDRAAEKQFDFCKSIKIKNK